MSRHNNNLWEVVRFPVYPNVDKFLKEIEKGTDRLFGTIAELTDQNEKLREKYPEKQTWTLKITSTHPDGTSTHAQTTFTDARDLIAHMREYDVKDFAEYPDDFDSGTDEDPLQEDMEAAHGLDAQDLMDVQDAQVSANERNERQRRLEAVEAKVDKLSNNIDDLLSYLEENKKKDEENS